MRALAVRHFQPNREMIQQWLIEDVEFLAGKIGERNMQHFDSLLAAQNWIEKRLSENGLAVRHESYWLYGKQVANLEVEIRGSKRADEILVFGAHYDSVIGCPGANDNATGVAALLALNRLMADEKPERTVRFVAFVNEEPPYSFSDQMGSRVYARRCRERAEKIVGMLSLETMGYYSDEPGSQQLPMGLQRLYPDRGNFIALVANRASRAFAKETHHAFVKYCDLPAEWGAFPKWVPAISFSDHWSFWEEGYPALMMTDTAMFRYPDYHMPSDTPDKVNYRSLAELVVGLYGVVLAAGG